MRWIFKICFFILIIGVITVLQIGVREFLPFPGNQLNIIFLSLIWLMFFTNSTSVLWTVLPPTLLIELFSPLPFGFNTLALTLGLSFASWLLVVLFTNHSIFIVFAVGLLGMTIYRFFFLIFTFIITNFFSYQQVISENVVLEWLAEIVLTNLALVAVYFLSQRFFKRLQPQYVKLLSLK